MEYKWKLQEWLAGWINKTSYDKIGSVWELVKLITDWLVFWDVNNINFSANNLFNKATPTDQIIICEKIIEIISAFIKNRDKKQCTTLNNILIFWKERLENLEK